MIRIRFHGRRGHGIKTASRVLGTAAFVSGYQVRTLPFTGRSVAGPHCCLHADRPGADPGARGVIEQRGGGEIRCGRNQVSGEIRCQIIFIAKPGKRLEGEIRCQGGMALGEGGNPLPSNDLQLPSSGLVKCYVDMCRSVLGYRTSESRPVETVFINVILACDHPKSGVKPSDIEVFA